MLVRLPCLQALYFVEACSWDLDPLLLASWESLVLGVVCPHECGAPERALDRCLVHYDRVLHVVPVVADYRHYEVLPARPLFELGRLHRARADD